MCFFFSCFSILSLNHTFIFIFSKFIYIPRTEYTSRGGICRTATTRAREGPLFVPYLIIILAGNHMPFARTFSLATPHIRTRHYQKGINTGVNSNWHALARFHPAANRCKEHSSWVGRNYFIYYYFIIILFIYKEAELTSKPLKGNRGFNIIFIY